MSESCINEPNLNEPTSILEQYIKYAFEELSSALFELPSVANACYWGTPMYRSVSQNGIAGLAVILVGEHRVEVLVFVIALETATFILD